MSRLIFIGFLLVAKVAWTQTNYKNGELKFNVGSTIAIGDKNYSAGNPLSFPFLSVGLQKTISSKISAGINFQYFNYTNEKGIIKNYKSFLNGNSITKFNKTNTLSSTLNLEYSTSAKVRKGGPKDNGLVIVIGAGIQRIQTNGDSISIRNPNNNNQSLILQSKKQTKVLPIIQFGISKYFSLSDNLFFSINFQTQVLFGGQEIKYKEIPTEINNQLATERIIASSFLTETRKINYFFFPSLGLTYRIKKK